MLHLHPVFCRLPGLAVCSCTLAPRQCSHARRWYQEALRWGPPEPTWWPERRPPRSLHPSPASSSSSRWLKEQSEFSCGLSTWVDDNICLDTSGWEEVTVSTVTSLKSEKNIWDRNAHLIKKKKKINIPVAVKDDVWRLLLRTDWNPSWSGVDDLWVARMAIRLWMEVELDSRYYINRKPLIIAFLEANITWIFLKIIFT